MVVMVKKDSIGVMMCDILAFDHAVRHPSHSIRSVGAAMMARHTREGCCRVSCRLPEGGFAPKLKVGPLLLQTISQGLIPMAAALSPDASLFIELLSKGDLALTVKDAEGRYRFVNSNFSALAGRSAEALVGLTDADLLTAADAAAMASADQAAWHKNGVVVSHEHRLVFADVKKEFLVLRSIWDSSGSQAERQLVCVWKEVTEARRVARELEHALQQLEQQQQALVALRRESQNAGSGNSGVGLYQRAQFDEQLRREVDLSFREHREFALVAIRIDPIAGPPEVIGDEITERVADALASLLRSNTRAMDAACRVDQTRFAVLLSGVGLATAHSRMEGLRRQCASHIIAVDGKSLGFSVSMGVASFPHTANNEQEVLCAAESALQEACRRGGNHVALASIRFDSA